MRKFTLIVTVLQISAFADGPRDARPIYNLHAKCRPPGHLQRYERLSANVRPLSLLIYWEHSHMTGRREEICQLQPTPPAFGAPIEFRNGFWHQKTRISGLHAALICVILHLTVLVELWLVTDMDRQTQGPGIYRASIASHGKSRWLLNCVSLSPDMASLVHYVQYEPHQQIRWGSDPSREGSLLGGFPLKSIAFVCVGQRGELCKKTIQQGQIHEVLCMCLTRV